MGVKTVPQPPYSPDLAPCDFCLFPKLRGCRYETIEEMEEALAKVIDTVTQENFHVAFQKLLERYKKCIAAGGDYFEGDLSFMCVLSIKVPIRKKSGNLLNDHRIFTFPSDGYEKPICTVTRFIHFVISHRSNTIRLMLFFFNWNVCWCCFYLFIYSFSWWVCLKCICK